MKLSHLTLTGVCLVLPSLGSVARAEEKTWIDLTFDAAMVGKPLPTAPFDLNTVNHAVESVAVTGANKLDVVANAPGLTGPALRFTKNSDEPRTPKAILVNSPGLVKSGKVRFSWDAEMNSFADSPKFPGYEALLTFALTDTSGKPFYNLCYLVGPDKNSGYFGALGQKVGGWTMGTKQHVEVLIDLDAGTASVKIDGTPVGSDQKFSATDGLRLVQFTDGTGLAAYGSKFTATVANFQMVSL